MMVWRVGMTATEAARANVREAELEPGSLRRRSASVRHEVQLERDRIQRFGFGDEAANHADAPRRLVFCGSERCFQDLLGKA